MIHRHSWRPGKCPEITSGLSRKVRNTSRKSQKIWWCKKLNGSANNLPPTVPPPNWSSLKFLSTTGEPGDRAAWQSRSTWYINLNESPDEENKQWAWPLWLGQGVRERGARERVMEWPAWRGENAPFLREGEGRTEGEESDRKVQSILWVWVLKSNSPHGSVWHRSSRISIHKINTILQARNPLNTSVKPAWHRVQTLPLLGRKQILDKGK